MENSSSQQSYTMGIWNTKPGKEEEFIKLWTDFAKNVTESANDKGSGRLLQYPDNSTKFVSFAIWDNVEDIKAMRESQTIKTFIAKLDEIMVDYKLPHLMNLASMVEG